MTTIVPVLDLMHSAYTEGGRWEGGALPHGGLDCWGLVVEVRARAGLWTPDPWGDGLKPRFEHPEGLPDVFTNALVPLSEPSDYCGVQLQADWPGGHAGVYLPDGTVLHACPLRYPSPCVRRQPLTRLTNRVLGLFEFTNDQAHD